jgi:hypothetical protein
MTDQPPEPYRPADQPTQPIQPFETAPHTADGTGESTAGKVDTAQATKPGNTKRILQMGAVGVAGLVAGSALTFAVTANNVTGSNNAGPGSGQLGGPGGRGVGAPGYFEGSRGGQPPGQNGQGNQNGQTGQGGSTDQGQTAPSTQPSTQGG